MRMFDYLTTLVSVFFSTLLSLLAFLGGHVDYSPGLPSPAIRQVSIDATTTPLVASSTKIHATTTKKSRPKAQLPIQKVAVETITPKITTPEPLIAVSLSEVIASTSTPTNLGALNQKDIFTIINSERVKAGLSPLVFNGLLSTIARVKALDMVKNKYFAHVAPDGTDIAKLAKEYQYEYLNVGENLALGDFTSSAQVMDGWMHSPGHRANILNTHFTEVGIAALRGEWEGREVWFAVQEFGRPQSDCPKPDSTLEERIKSYEAEIIQHETRLATLRGEIDSEPAGTMNEKVDEYNMYVEAHNKLVALMKQEINVYNAAASTYNTCVGTTSTSTSVAE